MTLVHDLFFHLCLTGAREWTRQRYGIVTALYLSFLTLATLFLYMISELSALYQIMNALTGMDGLPMMIVEGAVTTIYTCKINACIITSSSPNHNKNRFDQSRRQAKNYTSMGGIFGCFISCPEFSLFLAC